MVFRVACLLTVSSASPQVLPERSGEQTGLLQKIHRGQMLVTEDSEESLDAFANISSEYEAKMVDFERVRLDENQTSTNYKNCREEEGTLPQGLTSKCLERGRPPIVNIGNWDVIVKAEKKINFNKDELKMNSVNPNSATYLAVENLKKPQNYKDSDEYTFKLVFKGKGRTVTMQWAQKSWLTASKPRGFRAIAISDTRGPVQWGSFKGLRSCGNSAAFCSTRGWWAAVGQYGHHGGGIPAWPDEAAGGKGGQFIADSTELQVQKVVVQKPPKPLVTAVDTNVESVQNSYKCGNPEIEAFSAYWEFGSCGHFGNDYNAGLCRGLNAAACPKFWTGKNGGIIQFPRQAELKYKGISKKLNCKKARLVHMVKSKALKIWWKTKKHDFSAAINLKNCKDCSYLWHAQYECIERALTSDEVAVKPQVRLPPSQFNVVPDGCKGFKNVKEDCTNKDLFILNNNTKGFVAPTFEPDQYGSDALWATIKVQDSEWKSTCVAYVRTGGGTCKTFCESNGKKCVRAMDDAHHQTAGLSKWLKTGGYSPTDCTLLPSGHTRQSQEENGCNQKWGTQMCACN